MVTPFNPSYPAAGGAPTPSPSGTPAPGATNFAPTLTPGTTNIYDYGLGDVGPSTVYLGPIDHQTTGNQYSVDGGQGKRTFGNYTSNSTTSAATWMKQFAGMSMVNPREFAKLQIQLYQAGFYGSRPNFGIYTTQDAAAMKVALQSYLGLVNPNSPNPLSISDYLDRASAQGLLNGMGGGGGPSRAPLQLTDPEALKQTLQSAAQKGLGRNLADSELKSFVDAFHGKEKAAYSAAGSGSTVTPPDMTGQALSQVDNNHKVEEGQKSQATYLDTLQQMLGVHA